MRNGAADYKGSVPTAASKASTTLDMAHLEAGDAHDLTSCSKGVDFLPTRITYRRPDWGYVMSQRFYLKPTGSDGI